MSYYEIDGNLFKVVWIERGVVTLAPANDSSVHEQPQLKTRLVSEVAAMPPASPRYAVLAGGRRVPCYTLGQVYRQMLAMPGSVATGIALMDEGIVAYEYLNQRAFDRKLRAEPDGLVLYRTGGDVCEKLGLFGQFERKVRDELAFPLCHG